MPIVDSHCHVSKSWYEPVEVLLFQMAQNGVDHAILIQMQGQYNNDYQDECVRRHPGKFASVVVVDAGAADAVAALEREAARGASGVRLRPNDPAALWQAAGRLKMSISCGGRCSGYRATRTRTSRSTGWASSAGGRCRPRSRCRS